MRRSGTAPRGVRNSDGEGAVDQDRDVDWHQDEKIGEAADRAEASVRGDDETDGGAPHDESTTPRDESPPDR